MNDKVVLASFYIPGFGPTVNSVGLITETETQEKLIERAKDYVARQQFDGLIVAIFPKDILAKDTSAMVKELRAKSVAKYAEQHPGEIASEDMIRDYDDIPDWDTVEDIP